MEYFVDMTTHVPDGTPEESVDDIRAREAARAGELAAQGHLKRLWRPPLEPGEWRTFGLFGADDGSQLDELLASMPLYVWRTDAVTPLLPHPNDPVASGGGEHVEFLTTLTLTIPGGTAQETVDDLKARLAELMPEGPWLYPADQTADLPARLLAAEITREKLYLRLHDELPYASAVETEKWEERKDGSVKIDQVIFVQREGQKPIVLGKGGATIKSIGAAARKELAEIVGQPVHLFLFVKVREDWGNDPDRYREMGLEFPKE